MELLKVLLDEEVQEAIKNSVSLDNDGYLSQNIDMIELLPREKRDVVLQRILGVHDNFLTYDTLNHPDILTNKILDLIPFKKHQGETAMTIMDYPSAYFYGHKLLYEVKLTIDKVTRDIIIDTNNELIFDAKPVQFDVSEHMGIPIKSLLPNAVIYAELNVKSSIYAPILMLCNVKFATEDYRSDNNLKAYPMEKLVELIDDRGLTDMMAPVLKVLDGYVALSKHIR